METAIKMAFRKATIEDVEGIIELCNECFDEDTDPDVAKEIFEKTKNDENQIYLVGEEDGKIIAHVKLTIIPTMYKDMNTFSIINHFCVKESCRRKHIATEMINLMEKISKEMNCTTMKLWSNNFRKAAHACYYRNGFELNDAGFFSKEI